MLAAAFLTVTAASERTRHPAGTGLIPLTRNETAYLLMALASQPTHGHAHRLGWSRWRRRHQHTAQQCHYQRQSAADP